jgi:hypothetical protein
MSVDVWEPSGKESRLVERGLLDRLVAFASGLAEVVTAEGLADAEIDSETSLMGLESNAWAAAEQLSTDEIAHLIRFFTLVEGQVAGWDAGKKSPVIPLVKILKDRGEFQPELRKWVKGNTDNRYLPYGSAL